MQNHLADLFFPIVSPYTINNQKEIIMKILKFILHHKEYIYFFIINLIKPGNFEKKFGLELKSRGAHSIFNIYDKNMNLIDKEAYIKIVYAFVTALFFVVNYMKENDSKINYKSEEIFCTDVTNLILHGLDNIEPLCEKRMNELTSLAKIDTSTLPEEDKIFNAIAKVTQEFGFPGVTLERVAQKLGLAKSSLYTYFSNKKDMIKDLALKEMSTLINIIHEKVLLGKDFSEQIFLHLQSEFNYFKKRNSLISVFGWLSIQGAFNKEKALKIIHLHSKEKYKNKYDHRWLSVLVVAV